MSSDCEGTIAQTDKSYVDEARKDFAHARKINKKLPFSHVDEAALDMQDGQVRKAIDLDLQPLKYWPNYPDGNSAVGFAYYRDGQFENAVKYLSRAAMLEPREERHHRDLGNALRELASQRMSKQSRSGHAASVPDYTAALAENLRAVRLASQDSGDHRNLSYAYLDYAKTLAASRNFSPALAEVGNAMCADPSYRGNYDTGREIEKHAGPAPEVSRPS